MSVRCYVARDADLALMSVYVKQHLGHDHLLYIFDCLRSPTLLRSASNLPVPASAQPLLPRHAQTYAHHALDLMLERDWYEHFTRALSYSWHEESQTFACISYSDDPDLRVKVFEINRYGMKYRLTSHVCNEALNLDRAKARVYYKKICKLRHARLDEIWQTISGEDYDVDELAKLQQIVISNS